MQDVLQKSLDSNKNNTNAGDSLNKTSISWQEARKSNSSLYAVTLGNIWRKAERLLSNSSFIKEKPSLVSYPNQSQQFFVYSFSSDEPYTVNASSDLVTCNCPMYKSSPKICSHAVACAEKVGKLNTYLQLLTKKVSCNDPTGLALSVRGINKKATGCKGGKVKKVGTKRNDQIVNHIPTQFVDNRSEQSAVSGLLMLAQQPLCTITNSRVNVPISQSVPLPKEPRRRSDKPDPVPSNAIFLLRTIEGNIRKCAGCGKFLKELPLHCMYTASSVDTKFCVAHQKRDWYFCQNDSIWKLGRLQNRHFHINVDCLKNRNPSMQSIPANLFAVSVKCVVDDVVKAIVNSRLGISI